MDSEIGQNENVIRHVDHIRKRTLDKLTDSEPVIEFSNMQNVNNEEKHNSYVSSNITLVRTPNGNGTTDNNNETLPDENDTRCNRNTNSPDVNNTSGLRRPTRVRKLPSYLNYVT